MLLLANIDELTGVPINACCTRLEKLLKRCADILVRTITQTLQFAAQDHSRYNAATEEYLKERAKVTNKDRWL